jgi:multicomponent K+:H+ antiporter subunit D
MLSSLLGAGRIAPAAWVFMGLLLVSGCFTLIALSRTGIRHFWTQAHAQLPALPALEVLPVAGLLAACLALTIGAGPVMQHAAATAQGLFSPTAYRRAVFQATQVPNPARSPGAAP